MISTEIRAPLTTTIPLAKGWLLARIWTSSVSLVFNIAINIALMKSMGHVGIALGTTVSAWINAGMLTVILHRRGHLKADARLKRRLPRIVAACVAMAGVLWASTMVTGNLLGPVFGTESAPAAHFGLRVVTLAGLIGLGGLAYGASAFLFGAAQRSDLALLRRGPKGAPPPDLG